MKHTISKTGFRAGVVAFAATLAYVIVQLLQVAGLLHYPLDEVLIYGTSMCIVIPFIIEMLALHYSVPAGKRFFSHASLLFTVIYAVFVTANYVVQLATVIPLTVQGQDAGIAVLKQTPHSMFWNYDAIGYIFMGLAALAAVPVFEKSGWQKWVRRALLAHALVTPLICFVYFYPVFSNKLLMLGLPWGITAPLFMLAIAIHLKRQAAPASKAAQGYETRHSVTAAAG